MYRFDQIAGIYSARVKYNALKKPVSVLSADFQMMNGSIMRVKFSNTLPAGLLLNFLGRFKQLRTN